MAWKNTYRLRLLREPSLAPLLAVSLAACGGGGGGGGGNSVTPEPPRLSDGGNRNDNYSGRLYDGPVVGADVYIDVDGNGEISSEIDHFISRTDGTGQYSGFVPEEHLDKPLIADLNGATDIGTDFESAHDDKPTKGFWRAPPNSKMINPFTEYQVVTGKTDAEVARDLNLPDNVKVTEYDPFDGDTKTDTDEKVIAAGEKLAEVLTQNPNADAKTLETKAKEALAPPPPQPVDEKPTAFALSTSAASIQEGTHAARKLADIEITDDGRGTNTLRLTHGADRFEIRGKELWLKAGALDYETATSHTATIALTATGKGASPTPLTFTLNVADVDEPPTAMQLSADTATLQEGTVTARKLADVTFADDGLGTNSVTIPASDIFEIRNGNQLWLKADAVLDYETVQSHTITLTGPNGLTQDFTLTVTDDPADNPRPSISQLSPIVIEDTVGDDSFAPLIGQWEIENVVLGASHRIEVGGPGAFLKAKHQPATSKTWTDSDGSYTSTHKAEHDLFTLYYVSSSSQTAHIGRYHIEYNDDAINALTGPTGHIPIRVRLFDSNEGSSSISNMLFLIDFNGMDDAATEMMLSASEATIDETVGTTTNAQKLADVSFFGDPDGGTNSVTIPTSDIFEIRNGNQLWLKASAVLDYETAQSHTITLTGPNGLMQDFTLTVTAAPLSAPATMQNNAIDVHENYPLNKILYDVFGTYRLVGDDLNKVFRLSADGKLFLKDRGEALSFSFARSDGDMLDLTIVRMANGEEITTVYTIPKPTLGYVRNYNYSSPEVLHDFRAVDSKGVIVQLAEGYGDNALFTIDATGHLFWKILPDFENPGDANGDNIYELEIRYKTPDQPVSGVRLAVTVNDIDFEREYATRASRNKDHVFFTYDDIKHIVPADSYMTLILNVDSFAMLDTGPLVLTWSLRTPDSPDTHDDDKKVSAEWFANARKMLIEAFNIFEEVINVKFIEVAQSDDSYGDLPIYLTESGSSAAYYPGDKTGLRFNENVPIEIYLHEIGHALGLKHTFEGAQFGFRDDVNERHSLKTVMSYGNATNLTENDIAALQFLYGKPGEDFTSVEQHLFNIREQFSVYENHPTHKPIFDVDPPQGKSQGTFEISIGFEGGSYSDLVFGRTQHLPFRIDAEGKVWWKKAPDFENPTDFDDDNEYHITVKHTAVDGTVTKTRLDVTVQDQKTELKAQRGYFTPHMDDAVEVPSANAQLILGNPAWRMPETGPLIIFWSMDITDFTPNKLTSQAAIDKFRAKMQKALGEFEAAANLKFVEVAHGIGATHFHIRVWDDEMISVGGSHGVENGLIEVSGGFGDVKNRRDEDPSNALLVHEIGHMLGLTHPFEDDSRTAGWPNREGSNYDEFTIMSYNYVAYFNGDAADSEKLKAGLQAADIEALQWLYGAPGTDYAGVESLLITPPDYHLL